MNQRLIKSKISFLGEEKVCLLQIIEELFDKILKSGENWLVNQSHLSFENIKHILDRSETFFTCKAEEIQAFEKQLDLVIKPICPEQATPDQQEQTKTVRTSLPTAPLKETTSSLQTALEEVSKRLSYLEGRLPPLDHKLEKIGDRQTSLEVNLTTVSQELLGLKEKQTLHDGLLDAEHQQTDQRFEELSQKISEKDSEQKLRLDSILADQHDASANFKVLSDRTEQRIKSLSVNLTEFKMEHLNKIESVENQVTLMIDSSYHLESQFVALSQQINSLETSAQNMQAKIDEVSSCVTTVSTVCETDLEQLKNRCVTLEDKCNDGIDRIASDVNDIKTKYEEVCLMLTHQLLPLVHLRQILNDRVKAKERTQ